MLPFFQSICKISLGIDFFILIAKNIKICRVQERFCMLLVTLRREERRLLFGRELEWRCWIKNKESPKMTIEEMPLNLANCSLRWSPYSPIILFDLCPKHYFKLLLNYYYFVGKKLLYINKKLYIKYKQKWMQNHGTMAPLGGELRGPSFPKRGNQMVLWRKYSLNPLHCEREAK